MASSSGRPTVKAPTHANVGLRAWRRLLGCLLGCLTLLDVHVGAAAAAPAKVVVGVYVNQIYAVSLKDNHFSADFYVWFRYEDDALKPLETMEVVGGKIDSKSGFLLIRPQ